MPAESVDLARGRHRTERRWPASTRPPGNPALRALARSPAAAGRFSHSPLHNPLTGRRVPTEDLLTAFADACGADKDAATALFDARRRMLNGPARPALVRYTGCCDHLDRPDPEYDLEGRRGPDSLRRASSTGLVRGAAARRSRSRALPAARMDLRAHRRTHPPHTPAPDHGQQTPVTRRSPRTAAGRQTAAGG
ncbi:hypothetical protein [Streptomyces sp. NPDC051219]|uniref:hypothetical protein n=1 Tax=Streptomyces sp. NPDC051219 TaxID=3155283 RepID=UPI0034169D26